MNASRLFVTSIFVVFSVASYGEATCECVSPPGGNGICEDDQWAICKVRNGQCQAICRSTVAADNETLAVSLIAAIVSDRPENVAFSQVSESLRGFFGRDSSISSLLQRLSGVLNEGPSGSEGYTVTFNPGDRRSIELAFFSDPGPVVRFGVSPALVPRVGGGLRTLSEP